MTVQPPRALRNAERGMKAYLRKVVVASVGLSALAIAACQQRMADQPAHRPYEESSLFPHKQSSRPLEKGTLHRNQPTDDDPLATWLSPKGKLVKNDVAPSGSASFDPKSITPLLGAPNDPDNFVEKFPFAMTAEDLKRGQTMYNANCALCHGAAGYANGKIPERGYLRPPSYHTDPDSKEMDWSTLSPETGLPLMSGLPAGHSRGFFRWGRVIAIKDVPVGYIYQVITWGYGGMGSHEVQIARPEDRWRVIAYIRALQYSQNVPASKLSDEAKAELTKRGETK